MNEAINQDVLNATDNFYKLKSDYEDKKKDVLKKAKKMYLSKRKDLKGFKKYVIGIKFPCVNCKRNVNSIFIIKNYELKAKCGDLDKPCRLNIDINRGIFLPYDKIINGDGIIEGLGKQINRLKLSIINVKTKFILKLISDVEAISFFDKYYEELAELLESIALREDVYLDLINNETNIEKIQDKRVLKNNVIQDIKKGVSEYISSEYKDKHKIVEIIDKYLTVLIPTISELDSLQYRICEIDGKKLNKVDINYHNTEQVFYDAEEQSIIANDYGVKEVKRRNLSEYEEEEEEEEEFINIGD
jgi:hypothetical protein